MLDMARRCLYCAETQAGALVPRTLEETPSWARAEGSCAF